MREKIKSLPVLLQLRKLKYKRKFENNKHENLFHGIYNYFDDASLHTPKTRPLGYDNKESASFYKQWMTTIRLSDYPVLYWLSRLVSQTHRLYDLGGHIGFLNYSYQKYLDLPDDYEWYVYDVPAVVEEGKTIAKQNNNNQLHFTTSHTPLSDANILLASGSLQYIKEDLPNILNSINIKNLSQIIINMTPMHPDKEFFTINSIGTAFCPYKIMHKESFLAVMKQSGWDLVDEWENSEKSCYIPFTDLPKKIKYFGFYFKKSESS